MVLTQKTASKKQIGGTARPNTKSSSVSLPTVVFQGLVIGLCAAVLLLFILSVFTSIYDMPENIVNCAVAVVSVICSFITGVYSAVRLKRQGLVTGALLGALFASVSVLVGFVILRTVSVSAATLADIGIGSLGGALGGVIGINASTNRRRKRT